MQYTVRGFCLMSMSKMVAVSTIFVMKAVVDCLSLHLLAILNRFGV
jgi:hypothetical protein